MDDRRVWFGLIFAQAPDAASQGDRAHDCAVRSVAQAGLCGRAQACALSRKNCGLDKSHFRRVAALGPLNCDFKTTTSEGLARSALRRRSPPAVEAPAGQFPRDHFDYEPIGSIPIGSSSLPAVLSRAARSRTRSVLKRSAGAAIFGAEQAALDFAKLTGDSRE